MTSTNWQCSTLDGPMIYTCPHSVPSFTLGSFTPQLLTIPWTPGPSPSWCLHLFFPTSNLENFYLSLKQNQSQFFIEESEGCWETKPPCKHLSSCLCPSQCCFQSLCFHCFFNNDSLQNHPHGNLSPIYGWKLCTCDGESISPFPPPPVVTLLFQHLVQM